MAEDAQYTIVTIDRQPFAIAVSNVREMLMMPEVAPVPNAPAYVRGVMNLRGRVLPVIDLRQRMGRRTSVEENEQFWEQRERDHVNWLNELEASVREHREFRLTLDPQHCAFGKWYKTYKTDDPVMTGFLKKLAIPHARIHAVGGEVRAFAERGEAEAALALIDRSRDTTLGEVRRLFADLRALARQQHREIAMVLMAGGRTFSAIVDKVLSVERFPASNVGALPEGMVIGPGALVSRAARRPKTDELILILEPDHLMETEHLDALAGAVAGAGV